MLKHFDCQTLCYIIIDPATRTQGGQPLLTTWLDKACADPQSPHFMFINLEYLHIIYVLHETSDDIKHLGCGENVYL